MYSSTLLSTAALSLAIIASPAVSAPLNFGLDFGDADNQVITAVGSPYEGYAFGYVTANGNPSPSPFFNSSVDAGVIVTNGSRSLTFDGSRSGSTNVAVDSNIRDYTGEVGAGSARNDGAQASASPIRSLVGDAVFNNSSTDYAIVTIKGFQAGETVSVWLYTWGAGNSAAVSDLILDLDGDGTFDAPVQVSTTRTAVPTVLSPSLVVSATGIGYEAIAGDPTGTVQIKFTAGQDGSASFGLKRNDGNSFFGGMTVQVVPEPGSLGVFATGMLAVCFRRRH